MGVFLWYLGGQQKISEDGILFEVLKGTINCNTQGKGIYETEQRYTTRDVNGVLCPMSQPRKSLLGHDGTPSGLSTGYWKYDFCRICSEILGLQI